MGDLEIDAQEDENITHTAVVSQDPLPGTTNRIKIPIMNKQVFFIPLTTPGVLGFCRNGKSSAYTHAKVVPNTTTLTPPKIIVYTHTPSTPPLVFQVKAQPRSPPTTSTAQRRNFTKY
jgi:hypothetical protein